MASPVVDDGITSTPAVASHGIVSSAVSPAASNDARTASVLRPPTTVVASGGVFHVSAHPPPPRGGGPQVAVTSAAYAASAAAVALTPPGSPIPRAHMVPVVPRPVTPALDRGAVMAHITTSPLGSPVLKAAVPRSGFGALPLPAGGPPLSSAAPPSKTMATSDGSMKNGPSVTGFSLGPPVSADATSSTGRTAGLSTTPVLMNPAAFQRRDDVTAATRSFANLVSPVASQSRGTPRGSPSLAAAMGSPTTFMGVIPPLPTPRRDSSRRVDPAAIPRPRYNAEQDRYLIQTSTHTTPPPSYHHCTYIDDGNCNPRFLRSTMYKVPTPDSVHRNRGRS
jgi:hypothetical protein